MSGCEECGNISSGYLLIKGHKICKECLCIGEELINHELIRQCTEMVSTNNGNDI